LISYLQRVTKQKPGRSRTLNDVSNSWAVHKTILLYRYSCRA